MISVKTKKRILELAGIVQESKEDIIVKKIGLPVYVLELFKKFPEKYIIWIANTFRDKIIEKAKEENPEFRHLPEKEIAQKIFQENPDHYLEHIKGVFKNIEDQYNYILDWLRGRTTGPFAETERLDMKTLSFDDAYKKSDEWHKNIAKVQGGQIKDEDGIVVMTFPDGFYWLDLEKGYSGTEAEAMGHCGRGSGTLFSLRHNKYPYVTADINKNEGTIFQMKGRANTKPKEKFHPYIIAFLSDPKINIKNFNYTTSSNDFSLSDLDHSNIIKLIKKKPTLLIGQKLDELALPDDLIEYIIKNHPSVLPFDNIMKKFGSAEEIEKKLVKDEKFVKDLGDTKRIIEFFEFLLNLGDKYKKIVADALYLNPVVREVFLHTDEKPIGMYGGSERPLEKYLSVLNRCGIKGKEYIKKLIDEGTIEDLYMKNDNAIDFTQLLMKKDVFGDEGLQIAAEKILDPNIKDSIERKQGETSYELLVNYINQLISTRKLDEKNNLSIREAVISTLNKK